MYILGVISVDKISLDTVEVLPVPEPHPRAVDCLVKVRHVLLTRQAPPARHQLDPEHVPLHSRVDRTSLLLVILRAEEAPAISVVRVGD